MALINDIYIFVEDESLTRGVRVTEHPTEQGINLTDNVRREPFSLSIKGKGVDYANVKANTVLQKIKQLQQTGSLINYSGRNAVSNAQIISFKTEHPNTIAGGFEFEMEIKEVRIAKQSYQEQKTTDTKSVTEAGMQQIAQGTGTENAVYHTVKAGDTIYNLVTNNYKNLGMTVQEVIDKNPEAFGVKGEPKTLIIGSKLLVGYRNKDT